VSLRARLLALVLLATLLPAMLLGVRFVRESDAEVAAAVAALAAEAGNVGADLDHRIQGTAQLHYGLAHSRLLDASDRQACSAHLSQVREAYPQYTGILTVLPDGTLFCDSLQSGRNLNLADRSYFKRVVGGAPGVTLEAVFGRLTGNSVLQVVYPARDDTGSLRFMLVASLNLQKFADERIRQALNPATELLLLDGKGMVMAWSGARSGLPKAGSSIADSPEFALARSKAAGGTGELTGADGHAQVWAVAATPALKDAGLHLLLGLPRQELVADATRHLRQGLLVLATAALLLFAGVWLLAEWGIRRQVGRITTMVRALGAGDLDARIVPPYPRGELGDLMAVLDHTAASLQQQREAIEELGTRLRQAQKLEAIGTLAGGIAHDFNNILGAILGNLSLASQELGDGHAAQHSMEQIRRAALRARDLVQRIQSFGRTSAAVMTQQPLRPIVEEVLALVEAAMPVGTTLQRRLEPLPGTVLADATQLHQVLMNLCTNAWQALEGRGGTVTVGLQSVVLGEDAARRPAGSAPGAHAHFWVSDNGRGIDAALRERIFEPFFTTKGAHGGTGLGLSVVHGIVAAHHGCVAVHSAPGLGSTFSLYLPLRVDEQPGSAGAGGPAEDARVAPGAGQHVMCVDDDEVMCLLLERLLMRAGYRTSCFADAASALAALGADPQAFDLVVTDFNMPGQSGLDLSTAAATLRPGLPVILISGYIFENLPEQARRAGVCEVIRKQCVLEDLLGAVDRALRSAHTVEA
jgi:signal transduction histidine kinase/ActR/RegA family two-component response regulator